MMSKENLARTLDELLAFVEARLVKRTLPDGRQLVWDDTRRLTAEEMDRLFVLDQTAGLQAKACGLGLPALPARIPGRDSHLPYTHLPFLYGPGMRLRPTRVWLAEVRAIRAVAGAVREERLPEQDWMPAKKAVERANREGVAITLPTVSKWRGGGKLGLKTRERTLPGLHRWEVEYYSLVLLGRQSAVASDALEPCEGSFDEGIKRAKAAGMKRLG